MFKRNAIVLFFALFVSANLFSNNDSLKVKLKRAKNDSVRIEILYKETLKKTNFSPGADSLLNEIYQFRFSRDCYIKVFVRFKIARYYLQKDSPNKAFDKLIEGLKIADSCDNQLAAMMIRNSMALANKMSGNFKVAIKDAHISLSLAKELRDSMAMADNYTLLGNMYKTDLLLDSALLYHQMALKIREDKKDLPTISLSYNNLALVYKNKKDYDQALSYLRKCLTLKIKLKERMLASVHNNINIVFFNKKMYDSSIYYSNKVVAEGLKFKNGKSLNEGLNSLAIAFDGKKDIAKALHYYKRLQASEDSVDRENITAQNHELQSKYESDKKDSELRRKEGDISIQKTRNRMKNILIAFAGIAIALSIVAIIFIFRSYRRSKRTAKDLALKNKMIGQKNKEITDSINYAQNIQQSLLTGETVFKESVNDFFILFNPKDIVSGDFYWAKKVSDGFMVMCADCTGHGVPGAFMSLLGISHLNEITGTLNVHQPDLVLNELRKSLINGFGLKDNKDGMDASFIKIQGQQLEMAAANNPVWIIRDKKNIVLKPNKFPIGKHHGQIQDFTLTKFDTVKNDLIIMLTDGYADQFGGPKNKKFKYRRLEELIINNSELPLKALKEILNKEIAEWKGRNEQVDDVLVIGIRV